MHLFNQNYHIQIHLRKLQIEKQKTKTWGAREILWKDH